MRTRATSCDDRETTRVDPFSGGNHFYHLRLKFNFFEVSFILRCERKLEVDKAIVKEVVRISKNCMDLWTVDFFFRLQGVIHINFDFF